MGQREPQQLLGAAVAGIVLSSHDLYDAPTYRPDVIPYRLRSPLLAIEDAMIGVYERLSRWFSSASPNQPSSARTDISLASLEEIADLLEARQIPLLLIYHPTIPERQRSPHPARGVFEAWAQQRNLEFIDFGATA